MLRASSLACVVLGLLVLSAAEPASGGAEELDDDDLPPIGEEEALFESEEIASRLRSMRMRVQRALDGESLVRARRWGNVANGALLVATGPVALTVSLFGFRLSNAVLSLYVTALGGLLAGVELNVKPIVPWVRSNLAYLMTQQGRTALLAFMGGLTWPLGKLGAIPALLTCANAVFNFHFNKLVAFVSEDDGGGDGGDKAAAAAAAAAEAAATEMAAAEAEAAEMAAAEAAAAELAALRSAAAAEAAATAAGGSPVDDLDLEQALAQARAAQRQAQAA